MKTQPGPKFVMQLKLNPNYFRQIYQKCYKQNIKLNVNKQKLYLLEQHSESFEIWLASISINTEGKSLIMKLGPVLVVMTGICMYRLVVFVLHIKVSRTPMYDRLLC